MKIALLGYGKMGKTIAELAPPMGHEIVFHSSLDESKRIQNKELNEADLVIEFTSPASACQNVMQCLEAGYPIVSGTTGWFHQYKNEILKKVTDLDGSFFYASNFSIGVNIFFELNKKLAQLMESKPDYQCSIHEIHHVHKKDAPSGTAISLADQIIGNHSLYDQWTLPNQDTNNLAITIQSERIDEVPGTHSVFYRSNIDEIEIKHIAFNRNGFAQGALVAASFLLGKKGFWEMKDLLK